MKIWIKVLIGALLGILLGVFLPLNETMATLMKWASQAMIHLGRYILIPLLFFSAASAVHTLREEKRFFRVYGKAGLFLLGTTLLLTLLGVLSTVLLPLERIPIIIEEKAIQEVPGIIEIFTTVFPKNLFQIFAGSGTFLLPFYVLAVIMGVSFGFDKLATRPVIQLFDSLSRIFYHINGFLMEILGFLLIPIMTWLCFQIRGVQEISLYYETILLLAINGAVVLFGLYPLCLYLLGNRTNPYKWVFGSISTLTTAFISGDSMLAMIPMIHDSKENLGIPRSTGTPSLTFFTIFGKAGTALITGISFSIILKSYSSLGITFTSVLWILTFSFLISLLTGFLPGTKNLITLMLMCGIYGHGLQKGHLLLNPIIPLLISFAAVIDAATALWSTLLITQSENLKKEISISRFS